MKKTTINRLARLILNKSDYKLLNIENAKFIAKALIRLKYCKIKEKK